MPQLDIGSPAARGRLPPAALPRHPSFNPHHHLQLKGQRKIGTAAGGVQPDGSFSRWSAPVGAPLPKRTFQGGGRFQPPALGCVSSDVGCVVWVGQQGSTPPLVGALVGTRGTKRGCRGIDVQSAKKDRVQQRRVQRDRAVTLADALGAVPHPHSSGAHPRRKTLP